MKRFFLLLSIVAFAGPAFATEVIVLTTSTLIPRTDRMTALRIQNLGPKAIFCEIGAAAVVNKSQRIQGFTPSDTDAAPDAIAFDIPAGVKVYCICGTLQVTGAATAIAETGK